jgi:hypothetical protein
MAGCFMIFCENLSDFSTFLDYPPGIQRGITLEVSKWASN